MFVFYRVYLRDKTQSNEWLPIRRPPMEYEEAMKRLKLGRDTFGDLGMDYMVV